MRIGVFSPNARHSLIQVSQSPPLIRQHNVITTPNHFHGCLVQSIQHRSDSMHDLEILRMPRLASSIYIACDTSRILFHAILLRPSPQYFRGTPLYSQTSGKNVQICTNKMSVRTFPLRNSIGFLQQCMARLTDFRLETWPRRSSGAR